MKVGSGVAECSGVTDVDLNSGMLSVHCEGSGTEVKPEKQLRSLRRAV